MLPEAAERPRAAACPDPVLRLGRRSSERRGRASVTHDAMNAITELEARQLRDASRPSRPGTRVRVHFQVIEGSRRRTQVFEGIVIKRQGAGARETFTVRKQSFGVGVERTFPVHSPEDRQDRGRRRSATSAAPSCTTCAARSASRRACARSSGRARGRTREASVAGLPPRPDRLIALAVALVLAIAGPSSSPDRAVRGAAHARRARRRRDAGRRRPRRVRRAALGHQAVPRAVAVDGADAATSTTG